MPYPGSKDFTASQGETWKRTLTWKVDTVPVPLSGYTAAMQVRDKSGKLLASLTSGAGITLTSPGSIAIVISSTVMATIPSGSHDYDLELTSSTPETIPLLAGKLHVRKQVTR